jgi:hypothetical protein
VFLSVAYGIVSVLSKIIPRLNINCLNLNMAKKIKKFKHGGRTLGWRGSEDSMAARHAKRALGEPWVLESYC